VAWKQILQKTDAGSRFYANPEIEVAASGDERTPHVPEKRSPTTFGLMTLAALLISSSFVGPDNLIWLSSLSYVYSSI
jgi:hypothetical protein